MKGPYQVAGVKHRPSTAEYVSKESQVPLPLLDLVEEARLEARELVEVAGRVTIEAVLAL